MNRVRIEVRCDDMPHPRLTRRAVGSKSMRRHTGGSAIAALALFLCALGTGRAHEAGPIGKVAGDLSFGDEFPAGLSYEWTIKMHRRQTAEVIYAVGAKSWSEPSNPDGQKGWTHTSNWIALFLEDAATVKITVERQQGVVAFADSGVGVARSMLVPALLLYSGWDTTTEFEDHTYNNVGNFWSTVVYLGSAANSKAKPRVVYKAKLAAGRYSIAIGGNPKSLGDPSAYPANGCDATDAVCYQYTGLQGYRATIETK